MAALAQHADAVGREEDRLVLLVPADAEVLVDAPADLRLVSEAHGRLCRFPAIKS